MNPWPSQLVLVRHGESERNVASAAATAAVALGSTLHSFGDGARQPDIRLTARGVQQAQATGKQLGTLAPFHRVIVSPFQRTVETARNIVEQLPYPAEVRIEERVREREVGIFDGLTQPGI